MATNNFFKGTNSALLDPVEQTAENPSNVSNYPDDTIIWNRTKKSFYRLDAGSWVVETFSSSAFDLNNLTDVDVSGATDGQVLGYDATAGTWGPVTTGGGSASALNDLSDVNTVGVTNNRILFYDGSTSTWKPQAFSTQETYSSASDLTTALDGTYSDKIITARAASTSQSVSNSDLDKLINVTGTVQFTLPDAGIDDGFQCTILNTGSGTVSFAGASGSTLTPSGITLDNTVAGTTLTIATLYHESSGSWYVIAGETDTVASSSDISDFTTAVKDVTEAVDFNAQTGTSYTLVLSDAGKLVSFDNAAAITVTIPPESSVAWDTGTVIGLVQENSGTVSLSPGAGVTIRSKGSNTSINGQWATAALTYLDGDVWLLSGDLA